MNSMRISIPLNRAATCKRCGEDALIWAQNKDGKWYLIDSTGRDGEWLVGSKTNYHKCKEFYLNRKSS